MALFIIQALSVLFALLSNLQNVWLKNKEYVSYHLVSHQETNKLKLMFLEEGQILQMDFILKKAGPFVLENASYKSGCAVIRN